MNYDPDSFAEDGDYPKQVQTNELRARDDRLRIEPPRMAARRPSDNPASNHYSIDDSCLRKNIAYSMGRRVNIQTGSLSPPPNLYALKSSDPAPGVTKFAADVGRQKKAECNGNPGPNHYAVPSVDKYKRSSPKYTLGIKHISKMFKRKNLKREKLPLSVVSCLVFLPNMFRPLDAIYSNDFKAPFTCNLYRSIRLHDMQSQKDGKLLLPISVLSCFLFWQNMFRSLDHSACNSCHVVISGQAWVAVQWDTLEVSLTRWGQRPGTPKKERTLNTTDDGDSPKPVRINELKEMDKWNFLLTPPTDLPIPFPVQRVCGPFAFKRSVGTLRLLSSWIGRPQQRRNHLLITSIHPEIVRFDNRYQGRAPLKSNELSRIALPELVYRVAASHNITSRLASERLIYRTHEMRVDSILGGITPPDGKQPNFRGYLLLHFEPTRLSDSVEAFYRTKPAEDPQ
ncbi:hypothetical protein AAG570_013126 [Ranatra chinensis]|uniref:Uncharacterized protein n=1 Tax=Ranatra chinensis TaxID=642074 RepID=A0ABD0YFW8_9HEMI